MASITIKDLQEVLGVAISGDHRAFTRLAGFADASEDAIVFAENESAVARALESKAGLVLVPLVSAIVANHRVLAVKNPKYAFALIGRWFDEFNSAVVHETARVEVGATIGEKTSIGAGSLIESGVVVGERCEIGANVTIHAGTRIGSRCVLQSGVVLGSAGFGYVKGPDGRYVRFPQRGTLWIGDDVEIGANSTVDRGALGETRIGRGTKIDNLVHIAHNCILGEDVIIAAQVGMAGSCVIEDGAMLGGQVGLGERVTIGKGVMLGGQGGVLPGKRIDGEGQVFWGTPAQPVREYLRDLARLRKR